MSHTLSNSTQFTSLHVCWSDFILSPEFHQDNKNILLYFTKCVNVYDMLVSQCSPDWLYSPELNPLKKYACILLSVSAFPFISKVRTDMQVNVWLIIFYLLSEIKVLVINISVLSQVCVCVSVFCSADGESTPQRHLQVKNKHCNPTASSVMKSILLCTSTQTYRRVTEHFDMCRNKLTCF